MSALDLTSKGTHNTAPAVPFVTAGLDGKRVGMVLFSYYPADPRPRRAAEALVACGMTVELICLREDADDPKYEVVNGVQVRRVPLARRRGSVFGYLYQYLVFLLMSSSILAAGLWRRRYHLIYVHNMPDFLAASGLIPKLFGAKVILDLHDPMPELMRTIFGLSPEAKSVRMLKLLERWSMGVVDSVVTVNRACAKIFAARSCSADKITVIMNSPDENIFRAAGPATAVTQRNGKPFVFMYHGSLVERNGLDLAVDAFAKIQASIPNAELRIYGSRNAFLDRVMQSVQERGLGQAVHYLGPKPLEAIVKAIEDCDVGVIPNQRNIFTELNTPTRIFEYLALGKPVIAPRAPGICDYFDDSSLIFFELGDADDLARRMEYVFNHPVEVAEITKRAQVVHRAHMWPQERTKLTRLVAELLQPNEGRVASPVETRF